MRRSILVLCGMAAGIGFGLNGFAAALEPAEIQWPHPFLNMPSSSHASLPNKLSETGAFEDVHSLKISRGLIPYEVNVSFWSDHATKKRWISVPSLSAIHFAATSEWTFPEGTVFVKHFDLATNELRPDIKRRIETRLLVYKSPGVVYGATYKWRPDNSDADLLITELSEQIPIQTARGMRTQTWYYPTPSDCITCHTPLSQGVLGVNTRQLNRNFSEETSRPENQIRVWNRQQLFDRPIPDTEIASLPKLAMLSDTNAAVETRARSYLDANCAQCHRPGGTVAGFDARFDTPLSRQNLIGGAVLIDEGVDGARYVASNDPWRSIVLMRVSRLDGTRMPPLAHSELDEEGIRLLRQWIESLPGPSVVPPPEISPAGGRYDEPVTVIFKAQGNADVHFTLDGSVPTRSDPLYERPIVLNKTTIVRARAFKEGFKRSIPSQQVFSVNLK